MATISSGLGQLLTQALANALTGGSIRIFAGSVPVAPKLAETGTLLGVVSVNAVAGAGLHYTADGTVLVKSASERWVFKALAAGTATWFRVVSAADTGADDAAAVRIQGLIGTSTAPQDMVWTDLTVLAGAPYTIDSFTYLVQPIG